jgi:predicted sugar kinase
LNTQPSNQNLELGTPAVLPLAPAFLNDAPAFLNATLQHPPVNLFIKPGTALNVSGARADLAYAYAENFVRHHSLDGQVTIEIELAIPAFMGLGSAPSLALAVATGLAHWYELGTSDLQALVAATGLDPFHAPAIQACAGGGLIMSALPSSTAPAAPLLRRSISHANQEAWAFVLVLPRVDPAPAPTFEDARLTQFLDSAKQLEPAAAAAATTTLVKAIDADDFAGFCAALTTLQQLSAAAIDAAGTAVPFTDWEQRVCDAMRASGALLTGRSPAGAALYGLVRGDRASIEMRQALRKVVALDQGRVMAAIIENEGVRVANHPTRT